VSEGVGGTLALISEMAAFTWFGSRTMEGEGAGEEDWRWRKGIVKDGEEGGEGSVNVDGSGDIVVGVLVTISSMGDLLLLVLQIVLVSVILSDLFGSSFSFDVDIVQMPSFLKPLGAASCSSVP